MPTDKQEKEITLTDNLLLYNKVREVPKDAQKSIGGGRLKGMTDINPMWRIKVLTEQFGVCGIGWYPEIIRMWLENGNDGEIAAFVEIKLYIKVNGEWSNGIPGIGGSAFIAKETKGLYTSDECYKMALTDAISVSCKQLGIGADVYWNADRTKYDNTADKNDKSAKKGEKTKEEIEAEEKLAKAIQEVVATGSKIKEAGHPVERIYDIVSKHNAGNKSPSKITSLEACSIIMKEFKELLAKSTTPPIEEKSTKTEIKKENN